MYDLFGVKMDTLQHTIQVGYLQIYIVVKGDNDELQTNDRRIKEIPKE